MLQHWSVWCNNAVGFYNYKCYLLALLYAGLAHGAGAAMLLPAVVRSIRDAVEEGKTPPALEGLLRGGMRNRDLWEPLGLRDEVSVAGIKFRALKKIRELLLAKDGAAEIAASLDGLAADADAPMDVQSVWGERRVSCPSRRWIARWLDGGLEPGAARFIAFHVDEVGCEWCEANRDDLTRAREQGRGEALEAVQGSSVRWLRSRAK